MTPATAPARPSNPASRSTATASASCSASPGALELVIPLGARLGHPIWRRALKEAGVAEPIASDVVQRISDSYVGWQENSFPGLLGNVAAGRIANRLDLGGTNCVVDAACASSLGAVHLAMLELASGRSDVCLTGGLDTFNDIFMYMCFSKTPALSPTGDARPFSLAGDGTALGEGLGVLTLKRLDDARRDGDRIYAVIRGVGSSSDGKGNAVYAPVASGQIKCLNRAYEAAGISPATVELVEAHGTGTKVGDAVELSALAAVYRSARAEGSWCALGSVKSQIGHTKAAAGAAGLIKAALALHHKVLPPTIKVDQPAEVVAPGVSPFYVNTEARPWLPHPDHPRRAAVSAFGFGGSNFHCVLEEAEAEATATPWDGDDQIVAFSGPTPRRSAPSSTPGRSTSPGTPSASAPPRRGPVRAGHPHRLTIVADRDRGDLGAAGRAGPGLARRRQRTCAPDGVYYGVGTDPGRLAVLFPGQGSQYVGMLRDLACRFPAFQAALAEPPPSSRAAIEAAYPHPAFDDAARAEAERALRATDLAQPAIGASSLGALRVLRDLGITPDAYAGHSFGELTALHAAGRIDAAAFSRLAQLRGHLMAGDDRDGGPRGDARGHGRPGGDRAGPPGRGDRPGRCQPEHADPDRPLRGDRRDRPGRAGLRRPRGPDQDPRCRRRVPQSPRRRGRRAAARGAGRGRDRPGDGAGLRQHRGRRLPGRRRRRPRHLRPPARRAGPVRRAGRGDGPGRRPDVPGGRPRGTPDRDGRRRSSAIAAVTALALDASQGKAAGVVDLARTVARLAALGHPVRLDAWDGGSSQVPRLRKAGLTVPVTGANFTPKPVVRPPLQPAAAWPRSPPSAAPVDLPLATETGPRDAAPDLVAPTPGRRPRRRAAERPASRRSTPPALAPPAIRAVPVPPAPITAAPAPCWPRRSGRRRKTWSPSSGWASRPPTCTASSSKGRTGRRRPSSRSSTISTSLTLGAIGWRRPHPGPSAIAPPVPPPPPTPRRSPRGPRRPRPAPLRVRLDPGPARPVAPPDPPVAGTPPVARRRPLDPPRPPPAARTTLAAVHAALSEVVSEKTGYPADVLEPAMQLDADLGIDSIKRVEILAAIQERLPQAPVIGPEHLGTIRTLGQIADFLAGGSVDGLQPAPPAPPPSRHRGRRRRGACGVGRGGQPRRPATPPTSWNRPCSSTPTWASTRSSASRSSPPSRSGCPRPRSSVPSTWAPSAPSDRSPTSSPGECRTTRAGRCPPPSRASTPPRCMRRWPRWSARRPATPPTSWNRPCSSTRTWASTRSSGSRSSPPSRSGCRRPRSSVPSTWAPSAPWDRSPTSSPGEQPHPTAGAGRTAPGPASRRPATAEPPVRRLIPTPVAAARLGADDGRLAGRRRRLGRRRRVDSGGGGRGPPGGTRAPGRQHHRARRGRSCSPQWPGGAGPLRRDRAGGRGEPRRLPPPPRRRPRAPQSGPLRRGVRGRDPAGWRVRPGRRRAGPAFDADSGGLVGLVKTAGHEWPEVNCKAIDVDPTWDVAAAAEAIVAEMPSAGRARSGFRPAGKVKVALRAAAIDPSESVAPLGPNDVVLVSGGARGVTAEVAVALAGAFRPTVVLLGRSPTPEPEADWLRTSGDEAAIKRALHGRSTGKVSPQSLNDEYRRIAANREVLANLRRIEAHGARVLYRSVDVRDHAAVATVVDSIRREVGPIRGLIHGAGVLADRKIEDQTDEQFAQVFGTKVGGLDALLAAIGGDDLRALVLFSSSTARFGRTGQVAYAAANEVLNKRAAVEAAARPGCRVVAVNWGPWAGGMVTPALKALFESEGIATIPLRPGRTT